jgi:hypothetical protein
MCIFASMKDAIFIPGNTPSSKNGRQWTGKYSVGSKSTQKFYRESKEHWEAHRLTFLKLLKGKEAPYKIEMTFVRGSHRKFDYINPAQTIQDQMVKYKWLSDDNMECMIPSFQPFQYDKEKPGCYIRVL